MSTRTLPRVVVGSNADRLKTLSLECISYVRAIRIEKLARYWSVDYGSECLLVVVRGLFVSPVELGVCVMISLASSSPATTLFADDGVAGVVGVRLN